MLTFEEQTSCLLTHASAPVGNRLCHKEAINVTTKKVAVLIVLAWIFSQVSWGWAQTEVILFKLESQAAVSNHPFQRTIFSLGKPAIITKIMTYHWNDGRGAPPGSIALKNLGTGEMVGRWKVIGTYHAFNLAPGNPWPSRGDGPPFLYWNVQPNVSVPAGEYEVLDSDPGTWSYNAEMGNRGCAWVFGTHGGGGDSYDVPTRSATPEIQPTPVSPSTAVSGGGHWERRGAEIQWAYGPPTDYSNGQSRVLTPPPRTGDYWHGGDTWRHRLDFVSSNRISISDHDDRAGDNDWRHGECSWTEPPSVLSPGQTVQLQLQYAGSSNCYIYRYQGGQNSNAPLAHLGNTGRATTPPYQVPDPHDINNDPSKAEFGFFCGLGSIYTYYRYHWVAGPARAYSPGSASGAMSVRIVPSSQTINSGDRAVTTADVAGGVPPYTYAWFNGVKQSQVIKGGVAWTMKGAGTRDIKVVVTDAAGNTAEAHAQIEVR